MTNEKFSMTNSQFKLTPSVGLLPRCAPVVPASRSKRTAAPTPFSDPARLPDRCPRPGFVIYEQLELNRGLHHAAPPPRAGVHADQGQSAFPRQPGSPLASQENGIAKTHVQFHVNGGQSASDRCAARSCLRCRCRSRRRRGRRWPCCHCRDRRWPCCHCRGRRWPCCRRQGRRRRDRCWPRCRCRGRRGGDGCCRAGPSCVG